jgi:hypothetical protein
MVKIVEIVLLEKGTKYLNRHPQLQRLNNSKNVLNEYKVLDK